ncbi:O-antigen ligase family protein [Chromobacterium vaccinii]|uniref:O-antigen ligase family protein n=1 Tax=Chromobacterium vaccinii TaxID=1108595 RepID=UPI003C72A57A
MRIDLRRLLQLDTVLVALALVFLTMANVSHTVALRYAILGVLLLACLPDLTVERPLRLPALLLGGFVAYAALHAVLLSHWTEYALTEIYSQLLVGALWFVVGVILFRRRLPVSIMDLVVLAGMSLAAVEFLHGAYRYWTNGEWPYMVTFTTETKLEFTFFMNFVLAFVATAFCFDRPGKERLSRLPRWALGAIGLLILFVSLKAGARNGMIGLVYLCFSMLVIFMLFDGARLGWRKAVLLVVLVVAAVGALAGYAFKEDTRNQVFLESARAGWNYPATKGWLRIAPYPLMHDGRTVDESAYERVAWIHSGLDLIIARPQGYGFARNAFSLALTETGHPNNVGHSHSGFIDWGVGLGLPGVLLWLAFCATLLGFGYRAFRQRREILGLMLMLVTAGYLGRMLMESVNKDHMLYLFLFTAGALLAEIHRRSPAVTGGNGGQDRQMI